MKSKLLIMPMCLLLGLIALESTCFCQVNTAKTTAELIAEVEAAAAKPKPSPDANVVKVKSAAEIMAEIELLSTPTSTHATATEEIEEIEEAEEAEEAEETEETEETEEAAGSGNKELPIDTEPLPDEVIGEYAVDDDDVDTGVRVIENSDSEDVETAETASASQQLLEEAVPEKLFEKADALEPHLLVAGMPVDEQGETQLSAKIRGRIIAEKKPISRRRHLYRWVLKTEDGRRIPLKSNIKLMQEVRREEILDGQVNLTGKYISSGFKNDLQYFVVESIVALDDSSADEEESVTDEEESTTGETKSASATMQLDPEYKAPDTEKEE